MTPPLIAWAAVAPDGTIVPESARPYEVDVWGFIMTFFSMGDRPEKAKRHGWRVVQVEIRVMEDGKDE